MQTEILAIRSGGSGEEVRLKASRDGDLRIAQYLPPYAMMCAAGQLFAFDTSGAVAMAPDIAVPTTSPEWSIYNANDTKHVMLIQVGILSTTGALGLGLCILATVGIGAQTVKVANYTDVDVSCLDGTSKIPSAYLVNNEAIVGAQPSWSVLATLDNAIGTYIGTGVVAKPKGIFIAPPKSSIFIAVVGATGTDNLYDVSIVIAEIELDTP